MVSQIRDGVAPNSGCCGPTWLMPGGNQVTGWGGTPWFTEHQPDGKQAFRLDANFVYRAIPITDGRYTRDELRAGMDVQHDAGVFAPVGPATAAAESALEFDLGFRLGLLEDEWLRPLPPSGSEATSPSKSMAIRPLSPRGSSVSAPAAPCAPARDPRRNARHRSMKSLHALRRRGDVAVVQIGGHAGPRAAAAAAAV